MLTKYKIQQNNNIFNLKYYKKTKKILQLQINVTKDIPSIKIIARPTIVFKSEAKTK
jgi:hypothetical protein